jgi:anti-sigma B factor antagonist
LKFELTDRELDRDTHVIALGGELDMAMAPQIRARIVQVLDGGKTCVIFDLSGATFIDSTVLELFIGAAKRVRPRGGSAGIACRDANIRRVLEIIEIDKVLKLGDTVDEVASLLDGGEADLR